MRVLCCSTSSPAFGVLVFWNLAILIMYIVVAHCCFNLHFSSDIQCGASFLMHTCHLYIFFGQVSVLVFCPFFNQVVFLMSFKSSLCILDKSPLSDMSCRYFIPVCDLSSHSLTYCLLQSRKF